LARDYQNPCTTCSYYNSFEHVIEDCPVLLAKIQKSRGGNPQVQLISVEPHGVDPRVNVIIRGGVATREYRVTPAKTTEESRVRRVVEEFNPRKEKQTFVEARREFGGDQFSSSKALPEVRECGMLLAFDQFASLGEGKEVSKLVSFLYTFIDLIKDERAIHELQHLIPKYEPGKVYPLLNRVVHQVSKKRRTNKELHLNAQIGDYDIDYVVLDLDQKSML
jgi:hypothetical protein